MRRDLKDGEVGEHEWYEEVEGSKAGWRALYWVRFEKCRETRTSQAWVSTGARYVVCKLCSRSFRRRVTRRGTSVWRRDRGQCANRSRTSHLIDYVLVN